MCLGALWMRCRSQFRIAEVDCKGVGFFVVATGDRTQALARVRQVAEPLSYIPTQFCFFVVLGTEARSRTLDRVLSAPPSLFCLFNFGTGSHKITNWPRLGLLLRSSCLSLLGC